MYNNTTPSYIRTIHQLNHINYLKSLSKIKEQNYIGKFIYIYIYIYILIEEMRDVEKEPIDITLKVCSTIAAEANEEANRRAKGHARENIKRVIFERS